LPDHKNCDNSTTIANRRLLPTPKERAYSILAYTTGLEFSTIWWGRQNENCKIRCPRSPSVRPLDYLAPHVFDRLSLMTLCTCFATLLINGLLNSTSFPSIASDHDLQRRVFQMNVPLMSLPIHQRLPVGDSHISGILSRKGSLTGLESTTKRLQFSMHGCDMSEQVVLPRELLIAVGAPP
jgi:hypothetical protein